MCKAIAITKAHASAKLVAEIHSEPNQNTFMAIMAQFDTYPQWCRQFMHFNSQNIMTIL